MALVVVKLHFYSYLNVASNAGVKEANVANAEKKAKTRAMFLVLHSLGQAPIVIVEFMLQWQAVNC